MNTLLVSLTTQLAYGTAELAAEASRLQNFEVVQISNIYRRINEETEGGLSSEVLLVAGLQTKLSLSQSQLRLAQPTDSQARWRLLTFNRQIQLDPDGPVPHPDLHLDPVILHCAAEIHGEFEHPVLGLTLRELVKSSQSSFGRAQFEFLSRGERILNPNSEAL